MAVLDTNKTKKPFIEDRDENIFFGFKYPMEFNGLEDMTVTVLEAVKNNIRTLLLTELGERVMQPTLGVKLRKYLFEPYTEDIKMSIKNNIIDTFSFWLPFINVSQLDITMSESTSNVENNKLKIFVKFSLNNDITATESVQVIIGE